MDTEAEMKQVRAEQDDTPAKSSAAEDAPLVSAYRKIACYALDISFSAMFCPTSLLTSKDQAQSVRVVVLAAG